MQQQARKNLRAERGSTTAEFVLVVPLFATAMMFLIGLGYTLMAKQNAIVGARGVVFYRISLDQSPSVDELANMVEETVSPGREDWAVIDLGETPDSDPELSKVGQSKPERGAFSAIGGVINSLYQMLNNEKGYQASAAPTLGFVPRALKLDGSLRARSAYYLPEGTWTCDEIGSSSYVGLALNQIPIPDWLKKKLNPGCCDTYSSTRGVAP